MIPKLDSAKIYMYTPIIYIKRCVASKPPKYMYLPLRLLCRCVSSFSSLCPSPSRSSSVSADLLLFISLPLRYSIVFRQHHYSVIKMSVQKNSSSNESPNVAWVAIRIGSVCVYTSKIPVCS